MNITHAGIDLAKAVFVRPVNRVSRGLVLVQRGTRTPTPRAREVRGLEDEPADIEDSK
jgi:hypothetical protein